MKSHKIAMLSDGADDTDAATVGQVKKMVGSVGSSKMQLVQSNEYYDLYFDGVFCYLRPIRDYQINISRIGSCPGIDLTHRMWGEYKLPNVENPDYFPFYSIEQTIKTNFGSSEIYTTYYRISKDGSLVMGVYVLSDNGDDRTMGVVSNVIIYKPN